MVLGVLGGLTGSCADGEGLRVAVGWAGWAGARKTGWSLRLRLRSGLRQSGRAEGRAPSMVLVGDQIMVMSTVL